MPTRNHISNWWRGLFLIFLVYFYFLLFSQFTFLQILETQLGSGDALKGVLASMALSGIAGSILTYFFRNTIRTGVLLGPALITVAIVAMVSPHLESSLAYIFMASIMGLAMGMLTVTVAALLPALIPKRIRGRIVGLGTGLAYAICNLPIIFTASAEARAMLSGGVVLIGGIVLLSYRVPGKIVIEKPDSADLKRINWTRSASIYLVCTFAVLIWFDSAIFYLIQENRALKQISWEGNEQLFANAGLHLAGAILAGWLLDTLRGIPLLIAAWLGLVVGAVGLQLTGFASFVLPYVLGVSFYSTALVFIPSLHGGSSGDRGSFARAALVYAIAGWICSGLGIGMAENLSYVPLAFVGFSAVVLFPILKLSPFLK